MSHKSRHSDPDAPKEPTDRPAQRGQLLRGQILRGQILRTGGAWLGFSGLYAASGGTCPFCGQSACPAGLLGAGVVGGILAFGLQAWKRLQK